jgi:hypothetical protein
VAGHCGLSELGAQVALLEMVELLGHTHLKINVCLRVPQSLRELGEVVVHSQAGRLRYSNSFKSF